MTTLLIDGDIALYRAGFSKEVASEIEPGYWTWLCSLDDVKQEVWNSITFLQETLKTKDFIICLSDEKNFRKEISSEYKEYRTRIKRPVILKPARKWLIEELNAVVYPSLEGDDVMGILHTDPNKEDETVIVSIDKDMKSIPGKFYKDNTLFDISEEEANLNFFIQVLTGDRIDGYNGIKGIGPKTAAKILGDDPSWESILRAYKKAGLDEQEALTNARCARILRYSDYDHENKQPILWSP